MSIGARIVLGFASILVFLLIIAGTVSAATTRTLSNITSMETYSGLQTNINAVMHIFNETRMNARILYNMPSEKAYADYKKQLLYCDRRLQMLYEYIAAYQSFAAYEQQVKSFEELYRQWILSMDELHSADAARGAGADRQEAAAALITRAREEDLCAHEILSWALLDIDEQVSRQMEDTYLSGSTTRLAVLGVSIISFLVAAAMALVILRSITGPLGQMRSALVRMGETGSLQISDDMREKAELDSRCRDEIAQCVSAFVKLGIKLGVLSDMLVQAAGGDLTAEVPLLSGEDIIGASLQKMLTDLSEKFAIINQSSRQVNASASQLSSVSGQLNSDSAEQASVVTTLSKTVSDVTVTTRQSLDRAQQASRLAESIKDSAQKGYDLMSQMVQAVMDIDEASQAIGNIIKVIDEIAFQTNILALNASIEAAHAGQHGRGFAVVAEEVRNLAVKSAEAAQDTQGLIENTLSKVVLGTSLAKDTARALDTIVSGIRTSGELIAQIAGSSQEQTASIELIRTGIQRAAQVVGQTSATAKDAADAADAISGEAGVLEEIVSQFTIQQTQLRLPEGGARHATR